VDVLLAISFTTRSGNTTYHKTTIMCLIMLSICTDCTIENQRRIMLCREGEKGYLCVKPDLARDELLIRPFIDTETSSLNEFLKIDLLPIMTKSTVSNRCQFCIETRSRTSTTERRWS